MALYDISWTLGKVIDPDPAAPAVDHWEIRLDGFIATALALETLSFTLELEPGERRVSVAAVRPDGTTVTERGITVTVEAPPRMAPVAENLQATPAVVPSPFGLKATRR
jgi:hypothetical protein